MIESPRILVTSVVSKRRHMLHKNYQNPTGSERDKALSSASLRGSLRDMVCGGNTPPKGPYTEHEPQKRAERGFARPYGIPYGILAVLVEYRTVLNGRAKAEGVLGDRRARDGCSRRPTVESLRPYGGSSCAFANDQSPGKGEPHRRLRSRNLVCSEPWGFQYGLAKSRTENRQVMGCVGNSYGDCRCGPPLPDELQKSCVQEWWLSGSQIPRIQACGLDRPQRKQSESRRIWRRSGGPSKSMH